MRTYLGVVIGILVLGIVLGAVTQASDVSGTVRFFISENETTNSLGIVVVGGSPTGIARQVGGACPVCLLQARQ